MDPLDKLTTQTVVMANRARAAFLRGYPGQSYARLDGLKDFLIKERAPDEPSEPESSDEAQT